MKIFLILVTVALVVLFVVLYIFPSRETEITTYADYQNAAYEIEGQVITLKDGTAKTSETPNGPLVLETEVFGNEVEGDFDGDGDMDVAFLLTQSGSGSGTFYYVTVAQKHAGGYEGLNAHFLGDRIAPQSTEFKDGEIIVNFADRKENEPMVAAPTVAVSKYFAIDGDTLVKVPK